MFFDSTMDDERNYSADQFAEYFRQVISTGILNGGENLQVVCDGSDMSIQITPGYAWVEGYLYKVDMEPLALTLATAHPELDRVDRIVIRLDKSLENRYIRAFVLHGIPSASPAAPPIMRNKNIFEISLAQILVKAGKSFIAQENITDERFDVNVCGLAHSLIGADTTEIFIQFSDYLDRYRKEKDLEYTTWVRNIQKGYENWTADEKTAYESWAEDQKQNFLLWLDSIKKEAIKTHMSQLENDIGYLRRDETDLVNLDKTVIEIQHDLNSYPNVTIRMNRGYGIEGFGRFRFGDTNILCKCQVEYINRNSIAVYINENLGTFESINRVDNNNYRVKYANVTLNIRLEG